MILELIQGLGIGFIVASVVLVIKHILRAKIARTLFRIQSGDLPMYDGASMICNHSVSMLVHDPSERALELYLKDGHKTRGYLFNEKYVVTTLDLDLIKTIMIDDGPQMHIDRFPIPLTVNEMRFDNILTAEGDQWRRLRRAIAPALKSTRFKTPNVMADIDRSIEKFIDAIENKIDCQGNGVAEVHLNDMCHRYTLNLVFSSIFKKHDLIDFRADKCTWTGTADEQLNRFNSNPIIKLGTAFPELQPISDWLSEHFDPMGEWRRKLRSFLTQQTKDAMEARMQIKAMAEAGPDGKRPEGKTLNYKRNMIDYVLDQFLDGRITQREYFNSTLFLMNAADLTSAETAVHVLYALAIYPEIQDKLRKSIRAEGIQSEYLAWVLNESLRLLPPAPTGCSRTIARDITIEGGFVLPEGTLVVTPNTSIHRMKEYWGEDADEFRPERWEGTSNHHPMQFIPFGAGSRGCPGRDFALFELKKFIVAIVERYELEGEPDEKFYKFDSPFMIYLIKHSQTYVRFRRLGSYREEQDKLD